MRIQKFNLTLKFFLKNLKKNKQTYKNCFQNLKTSNNLSDSTRFYQKNNTPS